MGMRREIANAPTGHLYDLLMLEQVNLIKSLPLEAAQRVHDIATGLLFKGERPDRLIQEILRTGEVTEGRARLIARTETSRAASNFLQARAEWVGSEGYIWRGVRDFRERPSHLEMEGKYVRWSTPPTLDGLKGHAGCLPNCFTEETEVASLTGIKKLWRVPYHGELVDIELGTGNLFSATPNHPILTQRGWVGAGSIQNGDKIASVGRKLRQVVEHHKDHQPATFGEMHRAFASSIGNELSGLTLDFHGDLFNGDVDDVTIDLSLASGSEVAAAQQVVDLLLTLPNGRVSGGQVLQVAETNLTGLCYSAVVLLLRLVFGHNFVGNLVAPEWRTGVDDDLTDASGRSLELLRKVRHAVASEVVVDNGLLVKVLSSIVAVRDVSGDYDALSPELFAESVGVDSNRGGGVLHCGSAEYEFLSVANKVVRRFSGHVFTLESGNGWFGVTPDGIISKNCRCWAEPVLPDIEAIQ